MLPVVGEEFPHRLRALTDDAGIVVIEDYAQSEHTALVLGQAAVSEVQAEQVCI